MDPAALPALLILVGLFLLVVAWQVVRRPVQRRFAFRDTARRRSETALVIAGNLLGTALITASFIVGDTLDASNKVAAYTHLGPVDETITVAEPNAASSIEQEIAAIGDRRIEDVTSMVIAEGSAVSNSSGKRRAEPGTQVIELDFEADRDFGGDPSATGLSGPTPSDGETVITDDLADVIRAEQSDTVTLYLYGIRQDLTVARIVGAVGLAGFQTGFFESDAPNAFVAPGTVREIAAGGLPPGAIPPATTIVVSNRGDVEGGAAATEGVIPLLEEAISDSGAAARVEPVKQDLLEFADEQGRAFSELFLGIGTFAIVAGVLLLVNIFVMLAEERKSQLGMLRAVGMRRADLVRVFVIQGAIYSIIAGLLGAVLGIGVGWAIVKLTAPIFSTGSFTLDLDFTAEIASVAGGFCIGLLISMITVTGTSVRISRINIIRAIRDLPEPTKTRSRRITLVLGLLMSLAAMQGFVTALGNDRAWAAVILGPPIALFGLVPLGTRLLNRKPAVMLASGGALFWGIFGEKITGGAFFGSGDIFAFVLQGILLTFSAVILLSQTAEVFEGLIRRVAARNLSFRLSVAYPTARRFRTGLTLGMYSLVMFTMVFIAIMAVVFGGQVDTTTRKEAGGFDILAVAAETNPPSSEAIESVEGIEEAAVLNQGAALWLPDGAVEPQPWPVSGIDEAFLDSPPGIEERAPDLESNEAVYEKLLADPSTVVIDLAFLQTGGGPPAQVIRPGDEITVLDPLSGARSEREVIGMSSLDSGAFTGTGVLTSQQSIRDMLERTTPSRFYIRTEEGADPVDVAARLQGEFVANGVEADSFRALVEESAAQSLQFLRLMQGYLALGLLVGIAGLGVVMVRAVRDRRREVGVLRALGFLPNQVRRAFVLESGFVSLQGITIGSTLAVITAAQLIANGDFGEGIQFTIPLTEIAVLCITAVLASLLATAWPAQQASKIPPAVALRVAD